jgi:hypothetical protein
LKNLLLPLFQWQNDAPLPEDEPQVLRSSACGLRVCPPTALQPDTEAEDRMLAHSDRLVLPRITAPASRSRATSGASRPGALLARASDPAVVEMRRLAREYGIFVGPSSGAHIIAAKNLRARGYETVVTFLCDEGEKYISDYWISQ